MPPASLACFRYRIVLHSTALNHCPPGVSLSSVCASRVTFYFPAARMLLVSTWILPPMMIAGL